MYTFWKYCLVLFVAASCQPRDSGSIELTRFTQDFIALYLADTDNIAAKERRDDIVLVSSSDTLGYGLSVFADGENHYYSEDYIGQTSYSGYSVKVFCDS